jgi:HK97 family phage major capsid protein
MTLEEMRRRRAELVQRAQAIIAAARAAGRNDLTDEERQSLDTAQTEVETLKADIVRMEHLEAEERELREPQREATRPDPEEQQRENRADDFTSVGQFLQAVRQAGSPGGSIDRRLSTRAASGAQETVPSDGGFLVGTDMSAELLTRTYQTGQLTSRARPVPISAGSNGIKINGIDETSRVDGSRWGGVQVYWADEADTVTATKPKFAPIELALHKLMGLFYTTDELLQDTAALESIATQAFTEEFGYKLDWGMVRGTGVGSLLGILNSPCLVSVAKETGQAADTVVAENIIKMYSRTWARSRQNAVWLVNQDIEPQLFQFALSVGTGGVPLFMPAGGLSAQPFNTILGRPVLPIEQCSTLGDQGDIFLADFSQYYLAKKGGIQSAVSIHVRFIYDESCYRWTLRTDGQPSWRSALTPAYGTNTVSPFITLDARA